MAQRDFALWMVGSDYNESFVSDPDSKFVLPLSVLDNI